MNSTSVADFWNRRYQGKAISTPKAPDETLRAAVEFLGNLEGKKVLDLGFGEGKNTLFLAAHGARVTAVDVSDVAVQKLQLFCCENKIDNIEAVKASAFEISSLGSFDCIVGSMILHHLEPFDQFSAVLNESLKPGGRAFFYENNAFSDLLIWARNNLVGKLWIPKGGDDEEFPLLPSEVDHLRRYFEVQVEYPRMVFFQLISEYLLKGKLRRMTDAMDAFAFKIPALRRYSYRQYVMLTKQP